MLDHIAIVVKNIEKSVLWYLENFNAKIKYQDETWAMLEVCNTSVALTLINQHPPHIAFKIDNESLFPEGLDIKMHRDGTKYVYQKDIDGNVIELIYY